MTSQSFTLQTPYSRPHLGFTMGLLALMLLSVPGLPALHGQDASMVGNWESVARSDGGIGSTLKFSADGSFEQAPGAVVDFTYRVDSTRLVLGFTDPKTDKRSERIFEMEVRADSMTQIDVESGAVTRFARVGEPQRGDPSITGKWSFPHYVGVTAYQIFTSHGAMHLRVPFRTDSGHYELSEDSLTIFVEGEDPRTFHRTVSDSTPTLKKPGGASALFQKVTW